MSKAAVVAPGTAVFVIVSMAGLSAATALAALPVVVKCRTRFFLYD